MKPGKLPPKLLQQLLDKISFAEPSVLLGPKIGEDAAVLNTTSSKYLVVTTDPITFATDKIGWYVVNINANDIAVMGGDPKWLLITLLLPQTINKKTIDDIFSQIIDTASNLGITLVGGHTEITPNIISPIAVGTLIGEVSKNHVVRTQDAKPKDAIILTKKIALEGTSIIAREFPKKLKSLGIGKDIIQKAKKFISYPGISVIKEANIARDFKYVHSMHDPTEGGLSTALIELAIASNTGLMIDAKKIQIAPESKQICKALNINPMGLLSSGCLIITIPEKNSSELIKIFENHNIESYEIGHLTAKPNEYKWISKSGIEDIPIFKNDELTKCFETHT
tara:strand:- start:6473 stop:7486 length:1014 start_codon:yes stop_codon:yes gene_type:complete